MRTLFHRISCVLLGAALSAPAIAAEFDGKVLFWRHAVSGQNALWLMTGATVTSGVFTTTMADTNWRVVGVADFNGDGRDDILWRHSGTGQNTIWLMNAASVASAVSINALSDLRWNVAGVGDFNDDGMADILWRHSTSGQNAIWFMNGSTVTSTVNTTAVPDPGWRIVGVADFNLDGRGDILWRHSVTGQNAIWLMDGATVMSGVFTLTVSDLAWDVVGVGDFDRDGKADILWRHSVSGQNAIWFMNGGTLTSAVFTLTVTDMSWQVAGVADFNHDGRADILWRHTVSGQNAIWFMNGATISSGQYTTTVADLNWFVAPPDITPNKFSFTSQSGVPLSSTVTSNTVTIGGINAPAPIRLVGGSTYSINGGSYTSSPGLIYNGNTVSVRVTSSSTFSTTKCETLIVGDGSGTFCVQTLAAPPDTTPDPFSFTPQTGVPLSTAVTSNTITPTGYNAAANIGVSGGGSYSINGGPFVTSTGSISPGQTVAVRLTSSSSSGTQLCATLTIGGGSGQFCVTTLTAPDTTPSPFTFTPQTGVPLSTVVTSNTITPTGYNAAATISVSGGSYSINGGSFVTSTGSISPGQTVAVRLTSSSSSGTQLCATLTIGGVPGKFCATTLAQQVTVALYPNADNVVAISNSDSSVQNTVYSLGDLLVGCNWDYSDFTGIQEFVCAESLVKFNVATLTGKTIDSATLTLTTDFTGVGYYPRIWHLRALATAWSASTVTWQTAQFFNYYIGSSLNFLPPAFAGQTYQIDLKATVQAWANGTFVNNGLTFGLNDYTFPYDTSLDMFALFSSEEAVNVRPVLTVTYH